MAQESGFNEFESNYNKINNIDNDTWRKKKTYAETLYLVFPEPRLFVKLGDNGTKLRCYVKTLGEQFGDPIPMPEMDLYNLTVRVFDKNNNLASQGIPVKDVTTGEVIYSFSALDFTKKGLYYAQIFLNKPEDGDNPEVSIILPSSNKKYEIIVTE